MRSEASYRSSTLEVQARISLTVRWRDVLPLPRRRTLAEELSTYTTPAELQELEAILDQHDDAAETEEIRSILAAQADGRRRAHLG